MEYETGIRAMGIDVKVKPNSYRVVLISIASHKKLKFTT